MAALKRHKARMFIIKFGDGASPSENFAAKCTINTDRAFSRKVATSRTALRDCDPDVTTVPAMATEKTSSTADVTGAGTLHTPDIAFFDAYAVSENTKNLQFHTVGVSAADGGGYWQGAYHCVEFTVTGSDEGLTQAALAFESDGDVVFVPYS
jgi:hypothetical protein